MLAAAHAQPGGVSVAYWILSLVIGLAVVAIAYEAKTAPRRIRNWLNDRRLMHGVVGGPGLPSTAPLGKRLGDMESGLRAVRGEVSEARAAVVEARSEVSSLSSKVTASAKETGLSMDIISKQLTAVVKELHPNDGESFRDKVDQAIRGNSS